MTLKEIFMAASMAKNSGGAVSPEQIEQAVNGYLDRNPVEAYTLPVGGAELGGVKNGGNVTIKADGTMDAPEASGGGIDVTGASVGQIVQIASVDANGVPTAWQPVDLPTGGGGGSGVEYIGEFDIAEGVNKAEFDLGAEYRRVIIFDKTFDKAFVTTGSLEIYNEHWHNQGCLVKWSNGASGGWSYFKADIEVFYSETDERYFTFSTWNTGSLATSSNVQATSRGDSYMGSYLKKLTFVANSGNATFLAKKLYVWGERA